MIIKICDDQIFKSFLRMFNKYLSLYTSEFKNIPYNKKYEY